VEVFSPQDGVVQERLAAINDTPVEAHLGRPVSKILGAALWESRLPLPERALAGEALVDVPLPGRHSDAVRGASWLPATPFSATSRFGDMGKVQVRVEDRGIAVEDLPRTALARGFTTAGSLGHGLKMMLETADHLYLLTGPEGPTAVIEQEREPPLPAWLSEGLR